MSKKSEDEREGQLLLSKVSGRQGELPQPILPPVHQSAVVEETAWSGGRRLITTTTIISSPQACGRRVGAESENWNY